MDQTVGVKSFHSAITKSHLLKYTADRMLVVNKHVSRQNFEKQVGCM